MAGLAAAGPPDSGEPNSAAPLDSVTTVLPGASGASSASRVQWNTCATSTSQLRLNVCHVWCWIGRGSGVAPAFSTSTPGWYVSISAPATMGSAASAGTPVKDSPSSARSSSSAPRSRATPMTWAPPPLSAVAIHRPKPRLAPATSAVAPAISFPDITSLPIPRRPCDGAPARAEGGGDTPAEAPAGPGDQPPRPGYFIPGHNEPPDSAPPLWRRPTHIDQPHSAESPRAQVAPCSRGKPNNPSSLGSRKVTIRAIPVAVTVGTVIAYAW